MPWERWTEKDARKCPQSVWCVVGETTYLPVEIAVFEIWFSQERRPKSICVSMKGLVGMLLWQANDVPGADCLWAGAVELLYVRAVTTADGNIT